MAVDALKDLDPETNLPESNSSDGVKAPDLSKIRPDDKNGDKDDSPSPSGNALEQAVKSGKGVQSIRPREVQGAFGEYGPQAMVTSDSNFNEIRADRQSFGELLGKSLVQSAGTVVGMGIESIGFLGDLPQGLDAMVRGSAMDFEKNAVTNLGSWIREQSQEQFPIYKTETAQSGDVARFIDGTYWASHAPSIASTVALLASMYAGAGAGAGIARGFRLGRKAQRTGSFMGGVLASRHSEGMLEGFESFKEIKQKALDNGLTEFEAEQLAGEQAASTYRLGYTNMWQDVLQVGALMRGVKFPNRSIKGSIAEMGEQSGDELLGTMSRVLRNNPGIGVKQAAKKAGFSWKDYLGQAGIEGFEEFNQEFIKRLTSHNADIALGLTDGSRQGYAEAFTGGIMGEHLQDPKAWDAALMGFLGGAGMQVVHSGLAGQWNKSVEAENARKMKSHQERAQYIKDTLDNINVALTKENETNVQKERENMVFNLAIGGIQKDGNNEGFSGSALEGNLNNTIEMFEAIQNMSDEQLEALDMSPDAREQAEWAQGELEQIGETLNGYYNSVTNTGADAEIATILTEQSYRNNKNEDHLNKLRSDLEKFYHTDEAVSDVMEGLSSDQQEFVRLKNKLEAKKKIFKDRKEERGSEEFGVAPYRGKIMEKNREKSLQKLKREIIDLAQQMSNLVPKNQRSRVLGLQALEKHIEDVGQEADIPMTSDDVNQALDIIDQLSGEDSNIRDIHNMIEETEVELFEGKKQLTALQESSTQAEIVEAIQNTGEQLRNSALTKIFKRQFPDSRYMRKGDKIYRVRHDEQADTPAVPEAVDSVEDIPSAQEAIEQEQQQQQQETEETQEDEGLDLTITDSSLGKRGSEISGEPVEIIEVGKDLEPVEGAEYQQVEDIEEFMTEGETPQEIDPDRIIAVEEFDLLEEEFNQAVKEDRFEDAISIIKDQLVKSNYGDRTVEIMRDFMSTLNDRIDNAVSMQELLTLHNRLEGVLPPMYQNLITNKIRDRMFAVQDRYQAEIDAIDKAISKREEQIEQKISELQAIENDINALEQDLETFAEDILTSLQEQGLQKLDRRTKPARRIEEMEEQVEQQIQDLKAEQEVLVNQTQQLEQDLKTLQKIKNDLPGGELPSAILDNRLNQLLDNEIETLRSKLLLRSDATSEQLETLLDRYEDAQDDILKAIEAIENFHGRLQTLNGASKYLKRASDAAYEQLLEEGLLSETDSTFVELPAQIFNRYRMLFNKELTNQIREFDGISSEIRSVLNENRLTEEVSGANVDYWAQMNVDFPQQSTLLQDKDLANLSEAIENLELLQEFKQEAEFYENLLKLMEREVLRRKASIKPRNEVESDQAHPYVEQWEAPQRTLESAFSRPSGNSGSTRNPSSDANQRRYFRYINRTNFAEEQHKLELVNPTEEMVSEENMEGLGYDREEAIYAIITDENGKYLDEQGNTSDTFDADKHLYTSMPLPTYETAASEYGRTFDPTKQPNNFYLKKKYPNLKTEEARLEAYERDKQKELKKYETLRNQWLEEISENGSTTIDITGKSKGVAETIENAGNYSEGASPNSLSDVFENPMNLDFHVSDLGYVEHNGDMIKIPKGFVYMVNPDTGNLTEGAARRLNEQEVRTLIELLRAHVRQADILSDGTVDLTGSFSITDKQGNTIEKNVFEIFKDYIYSFDQKKNAPIDFSGNKKDIGGEILIEGSDYELFANNPEGEGKIRQVNPELVDALREYLGDKFVQVSSSRVKNNEPYTRVIFEDGGFTTESYESYQEYLVKNDVVGTWRRPVEEMEIGDTTEPGYLFKNQQVTYDVPALESESSSATLESIEDLPSGTSYVTATSDKWDAIWEVTRNEEGFSAKLSNRDELSEKELSTISKIKEKAEQEEDQDSIELRVLRGIEKGKFKFANAPETVEEGSQKIHSLPNLEEVRRLEKVLGLTFTHEGIVDIDEIDADEPGEANYGKVQAYLAINEDGNITDIAFNITEDKNKIDIYTRDGDESFFDKGIERVIGEIKENQGEAPPWNESDEEFTSNARDDIRDAVKNREKSKEEGTSIDEDIEQAKNEESSIDFINKLRGKPQQHRVSDGRPVTQQQFDRVRDKLTEATGIPINILSTDESLSLLETLRDQGYHDESFTKENLPHGMYFKGNAYIFGKENLTLETAFHEVAHPLLDQILDTNPFLFEQLKDELYNTRVGQQIIKDVMNSYDHMVGHNGLNRQGWSEAIVTFMGRVAESKQLQQNEEVQGVIQRIIDAIKQFFRRHFGSSVDTRDLSLDTTIGDLADILVTGQKVNITAETEVLEFSKPTIVDKSRMKLTDKNVKFTHDTMKAMNYLFFRKLFDKYSDRLNTLFTPGENAQLRDDILEDIFVDIAASAETVLDVFQEFKSEDSNQVTLAGEDFTKEEVIQQINNMRYVVKNYGEVVEHFNRYLQRYHIETVTEENLAEFQQEAEFEKDSNRLWQRESIKFSAKQNSTSAIRMLVGSLTSQKTNDTFKFISQNVDFGSAFNLLANHLSGTTTLDQKKNILEQYEDQDGMKELHKRLFKKDISEMTEEDIGTAMYLLQFNETFSKHFNDYTLAIHDDSEVYNFIDATVNSGTNAILREWEANTYNNSEIYSIEDGRFQYNQEYFQEKFPDKTVETKDGTKTIPYRIIRDMELTEQQKQWVQDQPGNKRSKFRNHYRTLNFLEELGIEFSQRAYHQPGGEEFNKRAQQILREIKSGESPDIFSDDSNTYQDLQVIASHEMEHSVQRVENQHQNIDGETVYNVVLNHYISLVEDKINDADTLQDLLDELPHLADTEYTKNSLLLNRKKQGGRVYNNLFNQEGNRATGKHGHPKEFTIDITEGVKNNNQSEQFSDLTYTDKIQLTVNSIISDRFPIFRTGDKKLERFMNVEFFTSDELKQKASVSKGEKHMPVFVGYLADELAFLREQAEAEEFSGVNKLLHRDSEGNVLINYKYTVLPNMFKGNDRLSNVMEDIVNGKEDLSTIYDTQYTQKIGSELRNYFREKIEETKDFLQEHLLIEKSGEVFKNNGILGLSNNEQKEYNESQLDNILRKTIINRAIANIEQTKLFTGHPAFYAKDDMQGSLDNFFHRMSGAAGTKKFSGSGEMVNRILEKFFPSNNRLYKYRDSNGALQTTKEYEPGVKPIIRSAVFKDPIVESRAMETISKYVQDTEAYENIEESDAMGLVSLDTYRDMKLRAGEWNEALERLYQWETRPEGAQEINMRNWSTGEIETVTKQDLKNPDGSRTVFTMLKPQYFGPSAERGFVPSMYKLAVMPVLPSMENDAMINLRQYMNQNDVNLVTFETANKVGTKNPGEQLYGVELTQGVNIDETAFNPDLAPDGITHIIKKNGTRVGDISYFKGDDNNSAYIASSLGALGSNIQKEYRGQGIGKTAYIKLGSKLLKEGRNLYSDMFDEMSPGSTGVWDSLVEDGLAVKEGNRYKYIKSPDELSGRPIMNNATTQDSWFEYWGLQLQTGNKMKEDVILGSQYMKQIISGIYSQGDAKLGSSEKLGNLADQLGDVHNALIETGKEELREELELTQQENGDYTTDSVENLINFLFDEALKRDANHNVLDGLEYMKDYIDGPMGLDVMSNRDKIENILASIADKRVISQDVHGGAKVQAASTFFEKNPRVRAGDKLLSNELNFYEDGTMEVYMPHYFRENFGDMKVGQEIDSDSPLLEAVGFRIPTSGRNVIENIKIKDFLPQSYGETVVLPSEIVAKAGSDFDVDKLQIFLPNYKRVNGEFKMVEFIDSPKKAMKIRDQVAEEIQEETGRKPTKQRIKEGLRKRGYSNLADNMDKSPKNLTLRDMNTREGLQNGLIDISKEIMTEEEVQVDKFTPIGTDILENVKKKIDGLRGAEDTDASYQKMLFDLSYGLQLTQRNVESISGTGLAALHVSDHVHATRYDYSMPKKHEIALPHNTTDDGRVSLSHQYTAGKEKESIGNVLNQITNMFIDGVKNPLSFGLNLNLDTAGVALYLTRAGVPTDTVFSFMNQPIIRDYTRLKSIQKSFSRQGDNALTDNEINTRLSKKYGSKASRDQITQSKLEDNLDPDNFSKLFQRRILEEYKHYEGSAQILSDYVNSTRIDTVAMGKNTAHLDLMLRDLNKINQGSSPIIGSEKLLRPKGTTTEYTKPKQVISGGQTGIDQLGLEVAQSMDIETGGTAPKGYKTEYGSDENLQDYGLSESESSSYTARTETNVQNSDGTIYFATNADSAGLKATRGYANKHNKPFLLNPTSSSEIQKWLRENNIQTLNVAGNRGSKLSDQTRREARYLLENALAEQEAQTEQDVQGFLAPHYQALKDFREMFQPFFIHLKNSQASELYDNMVDFVADKEIATDEKVKILDKFKSDFITNIILNSETSINNEPVKYIGSHVDLLVGENSLPKRIMDLKNKGTDNLLLETLLPVIGKTEVHGHFMDNLKLTHQRLESIEENQLIEAWRELFSTHPNIASDLVEFSFLQNGLQLSPMTFTKYIPAEIYMEVLNGSFSGNPPVNSRRMLEKFFENNYNVENLVPTRWGKKPDNPIWKQYQFREGYNKDNAGEARRKGINPYKPIPNIFIEKGGFEVGNIPVFTNTAKLEITSVKDFRNNRAMLSYGIPSTKSNPETEVENLNEEQQEKMDKYGTKSPKQTIENLIRCNIYG